MVYLFCTFYINEIRKYDLLWLAFFSQHVFRIHPCFSVLSIPPFLFCDQVMFHCIDIPLLFIHSPVDGLLVSIWKLIQTTLLSTFVYRFSCGHMSSFLLGVPRDGIIASGVDYVLVVCFCLFVCFEELRIPKYLYHFTFFNHLKFLLAMYNDYNFCIS